MAPTSRPAGLGKHSAPQKKAATGDVPAVRHRIRVAAWLTVRIYEREGNRTKLSVKHVAIQICFFGSQSTWASKHGSFGDFRLCHRAFHAWTVREWLPVGYFIIDIAWVLVAVTRSTRECANPCRLLGDVARLFGLHHCRSPGGGYLLRRQLGPHSLSSLSSTFCELRPANQTILSESTPKCCRPAGPHVHECIIGRRGLPQGPGLRDAGTYP